MKHRPTPALFVLLLLAAAAIFLPGCYGGFLVHDGHHGGHRGGGHYGGGHGGGHCP